MIYKSEHTGHRQIAKQRVVETLLWYSFSAVKEMASPKHTPACCLSMPRNRQEAGWCMGRVCQDYASTEDSIHICGEHYLNVLFT